MLGAQKLRFKTAAGGGGGGGEPAILSSDFGTGLTRTVTTSGGETLVYVVGLEGGSAVAMTGVTYEGENFVLVEASPYADRCVSEMWILESAPAGTASSVVGTNSGTSTTPGTGVYVLTAGTVVDVSDDATGSATATPTFDTTGVDRLVISTYCHESNTSTVTANDSLTEDDQRNTGSNQLRFCAGHKSAPTATTVNAGWTSASSIGCSAVAAAF
jgi:hypothetical protein